MGIIIPLIILGFYGFGRGGEKQSLAEFFVNISYIYHSFIGLSTTVFGNRDKLNCNADFCYITNPQHVLKIINMEDKTPATQIIILVIFLVIHRLCTYICLRIRTSSYKNFNIMWFKKQFSLK